MKQRLLLSGLPFVWRYSELERKLYQSVRRANQQLRKAYQLRHGLRFRWPIYDLSRFFINGESRRLYRADKAAMVPRSIEQKVIRELQENGLSIVQFSDLLPPGTFSELQRWAETLLLEPSIREKISALENGARLAAKAGKFYLVRPLGDIPTVDIKDKLIEMSLCGPILRIVCGYLGMFGRLTGIDLWYNAAVDGPDVASQRWHRDPEDRKIVKTFLYLRDVDETDGPFCYIPGTHNGGPFKGIYPQTIVGGRYPDDGALDSLLPPQVRRTCTGKAGTLIFCDTTGFHRGGHPTTGARLLLNAVYTTNASGTVITKTRQYALKGARPDSLSPAASYAIGHLKDQ